MKRWRICFMLFAAVCVTLGCYHLDELDRVFIYRNNTLVGTWRANEEGVVHIDKIAEGDTLTFKARTDLFGLANSSIDIKDDSGVPIDNIQSLTSTEEVANFTWIFHLKAIDTGKVAYLQVFLNVDPARNLPPPIVAIITLNKK